MPLFPVRPMHATGAGDCTSICVYMCIMLVNSNPHNSTVAVLFHGQLFDFEVLWMLEGLKGGLPAQLLS